MPTPPVLESEGIAEPIDDKDARLADKVKGLISVLAPAAVCDPCIAERLKLGSAHHATHRTRELAGDGVFERETGECALCGDVRQVTRKKGR